MSEKKFNHGLFWQSAKQRMSAVVRPGIIGSKLSNSEDQNLDRSHLICKPEDNPNYILKACAKGWVDVVTSILEKDVTKLQAIDDKKWTCLHHAVNFNKTNIIDILLSLGADINATDADGRTALHVASCKGFVEAVRLLLTKNANSAIVDNKGVAAIHVAVSSNKPQIIAEMGKFKDSVDFAQKTTKGCTPLHWAAKFDFVECAIELMKICPKLCVCSYRGLTPFHVASNQKASRTLEAMLQNGQLLGYTSNELLSSSDKEGNSPLHVAVSAGDLNAVKVCLEHGAEIEACQENQQNALHFACSQGILHVVRFMYETHMKRKGNEEGNKILTSKDVSDMTPLHRAALFDHDCVVAYLIEQGSNINARDEEQRTPLLLAAYKKSLKSMGVLLLAGADVTVKDTHQRNFMHYLVTKQSYQTCVLTKVKDLLKTVDLQRLVNEKDVNGCSPLHYASKDGSLKFIETLIDLGATVNLRDNDDQSPLHFAAKFGRFHTAKRLLDSQIGLHIINESDERSMSALHVASANGHGKIVQMLCTRGALIHKNIYGQTPLHLAAQYGHVETMSILLSFHSSLLDQTCHKKNTPLHFAAEFNQTSAAEFLLSSQCKNLENEDGKKPLDLAIENGCADVALIFVKHDRWNALLRTHSKTYTTPLHGFTKMMPEVYKLISKEPLMMDYCCIRPTRSFDKRLYVSFWQCLRCIQDHGLRAAYEDDNSGVKRWISLVKALSLLACDLVIWTWHQWLRNPPIVQDQNVVQLIQFALYFEAVLDKCHTKAQNIDPRSTEYWEKFDFRYLQAPVDTEARISRDLPIYTQPLAGPNVMVKYGRIELLSHPVCLNYLRMKWRAYGFTVFMCQTLLYVIFVGLLTFVIVEMMQTIDMDMDSHPIVVNLSNSYHFNLTNFNTNSLSMCKINVVAVLVFLILNVFKEFMKMYQQKWEYFMDFVNYVEWSLYVTAYIYIMPTILGSVNEEFHGIQLSCGAVAIFLAYFNLLLHMEWFDSIGIYIIMFRRILSTIVKVICIFSILFIAFAMAFYIILNNNIQGGFESPILSLVHTVMFMMGDWNYVELYQKPYLFSRFPDAGKLLFPELNFGFLILFVLLISILFINLLIGLAVGDIEMVRRDAQLRKLAMQVEYHTQLEPKIPTKLLAMVDLEEYTLYPNCLTLRYRTNLVFLIFMKIRSYLGLEVATASELSTKALISETKEETTTVERTDVSQRNIVNIQRQLDEMNGLLKLMVQKMEIGQEADYNEG